MSIVLLTATVYLAVINLTAFSAFGIDKWKALHARWRIPESVLLGLAAIGGSIGALIGMELFRHKTLHLRFRLLVPIILLLQASAGGMLLWMLCR
ncbi:MAG: DUF1294 domain-containing protein [Paludibacteraceae bacterium]|nr:DUF1294 domain-containing protein [Paludibacteraceae bacterium]MBQ9706184.1 DUF1294 domain-containing protein [Paludibacteraceae bacterium]